MKEFLYLSLEDSTPEFSSLDATEELEVFSMTAEVVNLRGNQQGNLKQ